MTLTRQIANSQLHHKQHLNKQSLTPDPCCPGCHPISKTILIGFRNYWQWLKEVIPVTHRYNQNTFYAYQVANQLRAILQNSSKITTQTQGIIKAYKNINQLIIY